MKETIEEMRARHEQEIEGLQASCPHPWLSEWLREMWAPALFTLFEVKVCKVCGKKVASRTKCRKCGKVTENYEEGTGTHTRPFGAYYCLGCSKRTEEEVKTDKRVAKAVAATRLKPKQ